MTFSHCVGTVGLLGVAACRQDSSRAGQAGTPQTPPQVSQSTSLTSSDSVPFDWINRSGYLKRLVLRHDSAQDTVAGLWIRDTPGVVGDTVLLGLAYDSAGNPKSIYRFASRRRHLDQAPVPLDFSPALTDFALSPDGGHIAYVRFPGDQTGRGVVRRWPSGEEVLETAPIRVPISDALTGAAEWLGADRFAFYIMPDSSDGSHWVRLRGSLAQGVSSVDTIVPQHAP